MFRCRCEFRDLGGRSSRPLLPNSHVACRVPIIARSWTASSGGFASTRPGRIFLSATDLRQPFWRWAAKDVEPMRRTRCHVFPFL